MQERHMVCFIECWYVLHGAFFTMSEGASCYILCGYFLSGYIKLFILNSQNIPCVSIALLLTFLELSLSRTLDIVSNSACSTPLQVALLPMALLVTCGTPAGSASSSTPRHKVNVGCA
uniref:Uncharacterized protein n=1 Tax=Amblyomma americanum TaxID=6943 RepID=A0A0C9SEU5_AMBAM